MALDNGVGVIVMDNLDEMKKAGPAGGGKGRDRSGFHADQAGIDAHTHSFIRTGQIDSKFGFAWRPERLWKRRKRPSPLRT